MSPIRMRWERIRREDYARTLLLRNLPVFAIEADVREFFEESNFAM